MNLQMKRMKKKSIIIGIGVLLIMVLGIWLFFRPQALGKIHNRYPNPADTTSAVTFWGEEKDRIRFSFRSEIQNGNLDIKLYDSEGNEIYKLDSVGGQEDFFTLSKSDTYTLAAECSGFTGSYEVKLYKVDE